MRTAGPLAEFLEGAYEDAKCARDLEREGKLDDESLDNLASALISAGQRMRREQKARKAKKP